MGTTTVDLNDMPHQGIACGPLLIAPDEQAARAAAGASALTVEGHAPSRRTEAAQRLAEELQHKAQGWMRAAERARRVLKAAQCRRRTAWTSGLLSRTARGTLPRHGAGDGGSSAGGAAISGPAAQRPRGKSGPHWLSQAQLRHSAASRPRPGQGAANTLSGSLVSSCERRWTTSRSSIGKTFAWCTD